jgi:hypothetical protein
VTTVSELRLLNAVFDLLDRHRHLCSAIPGSEPLAKEAVITRSVAIFGR